MSKKDRSSLYKQRKRKKSKVTNIATNYMQHVLSFIKQICI